MSEHVWDELLHEGPIQLMLSDTEMLVAAKPGFPSWTGGYNKSLTEVLVNIDVHNRKSLKELHEIAVEKLMRNPEYHKLPKKDQQIPLLMSATTRPIILTPHRKEEIHNDYLYDDSVYYDDFEGYDES